MANACPTRVRRVSVCWHVRNRDTAIWGCVNASQLQAYPDNRRQRRTPIFCFLCLFLALSMWSCHRNSYSSHHRTSTNNITSLSLSLAPHSFSLHSRGAPTWWQCYCKHGKLKTNPLSFTSCFLLKIWEVACGDWVGDRFRVLKFFVIFKK